MQELNAIILIAFLSKITSCESIVETNSGYIEGIDAKLDDVEAFLGIPYAEPPIGDLRFAKPVPKQPWTNIYEASSLPPPCAQISPVPHYPFYPNTSNMSEDCLYLNIWKPKAKPNGSLRPVIIYIHYGGFVSGSSNQKELDGSNLASKGDMVVVTINYRLGSFGFFLANIEEADGNMGLYDQIMVIEWVKDNAEYFEGDPDNIVLMGTSAGALSISAHIISPLTQNLFRRAIVLSGTILNPLWADGNEKLFRTSELVASTAGCTNTTVTLRNDPRSVLECLKGRPKEELLEAHDVVSKTNNIFFMPRVGDRFLPEDAVSIYRAGKFRRDIDVMFGNAENEGSMFLLIALSGYLGNYGKTPLSMSRRTAMRFSTASLIFNLKVKFPSDKVNYYFGRVKSETSDGNLKAMSDITGDLMISCSSVFAADFLSLNGNRVYFYKFGYRRAASPLADWLGTVHGSDTQFVFGHPFYENFTSAEADLSDRLINRLSAFVYTGNPDVSGELPWLPYSYNKPVYLHIGQDGEGLRLKPWDRCEVWRKDFDSEIDSDINDESSGMNSTKETDSFLSQFMSDFFSKT